MGRAMGLSADVVQIIALHHERWDGTGYPFGLQEDRTPLLARIVAIAQVFDDLTADKPEGIPLSFDEAIQQIEQQASAAFDPSLTELFCRDHARTTPAAIKNASQPCLRLALKTLRM